MTEKDYEGLGFFVPNPNKKKVRRAKDMFMDSGDSDYEDIYIKDLVPNINNPYPVDELEELKESIKYYGLQQNLVVKENEAGSYDIYAGHKRYTAMMEILAEDSQHEYVHLETVKCLVLSRSENEVISHIRKHETNTLARSLLKMSDEEKISVVEDYIYWLDKARVQKLEVNGKPVKGKTRDLIAERFNISDSTAKRLMQEIKRKEAGGSFDPLSEKPVIGVDTKVLKMEKQLQKTYNAILDFKDALDAEQQDRLKNQLRNIIEILN